MIMGELRGLITGDGEIATIEALCVRLVNDFVAGMVLYRLLQWHGRSIRPDGAIWKSDREWVAELGLSPDQMARVREKLAASGLVTIWVEKAMGAPTNHYLVEAHAVLVAARSLVGFPANPEMENGDSPETFTTDSQESVCLDESIQTDSVVIGFPAGPAKLVALGLDAEVACEFEALPEELISEIIDRAREKHERGEVRSLTGYVISACKKQLEQLTTRERARQAAEAARWDYQQSEYRDFIDTGAERGELAQYWAGIERTMRARSSVESAYRVAAARRSPYQIELQRRGG